MLPLGWLAVRRTPVANEPADHGQRSLEKEPSWGSWALCRTSGADGARLRVAGSPSSRGRDCSILMCVFGTLGCSNLLVLEHLGLLAGIQSMGNLAASAVAGLLWTAYSPTELFSVWPPGRRRLHHPMRGPLPIVMPVDAVPAATSPARAGRAHPVSTTLARQADVEGSRSYSAVRQVTSRRTPMGAQRLRSFGPLPFLRAPTCPNRLN